MSDEFTSRTAEEHGDETGSTRRAVLAGLSTTTLTVTGATAIAGTASAQTDSWESAPDDYPTIDLTGSTPSTTGAFPTEANELLIYVHGWQEESNGGGENQGYTLETALEANGYTAPTVTAMWNSNTDALATDVAMQRADVAAGRLATWLDEYLTRYPDTTVRAISHSLGGQVILAALNELRSDRVLEDVALLGAAVDDDSVCADGEYAAGIEAAANDVNCFHSENDGVICTMYSLLESAQGLGCEGADCGGFFSSGSTPSNYAEHDVTADVDAHGDYLRPGVGCVPAVIETF